MDERSLFTAFIGFALTASAFAQDTLPTARFSFREENGGLRFTPHYPPLVQLAGAPPAFYTYYWEFGDGSYSFEERPWHAYAQAGEYEVILCGTAYYDDNQKPPKLPRKKVTSSAYAGTVPKPTGVFTAEAQSIAMRTNRQPMANQELFCIISYRNLSPYTTDGRLHLFFNERKYPNTHFQFAEARTHWGEVPEASYSARTPPTPWYEEDWTAASDASGDAATAPGIPFPAGVEELLRKARADYRNEKIWRFAELRPAETRNLFVTLQGTPNMVRDTSALIHLLGVFAPFDPAIPADSFLLEIEIVNSHDPNSIAVSDRRMNFRRAKNRSLEYRVRFQNTGEGPAKKVEITVTTPKSLDRRRVEPLDWYPRCPICTDPPQPGGCLDTTTTETGLVFTFKNIYLPGTRQKDCSDRDSTKGFIRYRIRTAPRMAKLPFGSRAAIVFDKNEPVITNFARTGFTPGLSPGIKVGYGFRPDSTTLSAGYYFAGLSLSPYCSWRTYPQVELLTGIQTRGELPQQIDKIPGNPDTLKGDIDTLISLSLLKSGYRQALSFEVPFLLRRNLTDWFGAGIGGSLMLWLSQGEDNIQTTIIKQSYRLQPGQTGSLVLLPFGPPTMEEKTEQVSVRGLSFQPSVFGDLTLGSVRVGPHLNLRAGWRYTQRWTPFAQIAAVMTF
jgi:hypothetical protein